MVDNCRWMTHKIKPMRCPAANEEMLTNAYCQTCLLAHISNQLDKLIKMQEANRYEG